MRRSLILRTAMMTMLAALPPHGPMAGRRDSFHWSDTVIRLPEIQLLEARNDLLFAGESRRASLIRISEVAP
jgi:hypothetical protein